MFAAGFTRKAAPSACARRFRDPRRSQYTPVSGTAGDCRVAVNALDWTSIEAMAAPARDPWLAQRRGSAGDDAVVNATDGMLGAHGRARPRDAPGRTAAGAPGVRAGGAGAGGVPGPGRDLCDGCRPPRASAGRGAPGRGSRPGDRAPAPAAADLRTDQPWRRVPACRHRPAG